jgi:peptidyl-prolyl cis-trans isomerase A (cyclophilin A)
MQPARVYLSLLALAAVSGLVYPLRGMKLARYASPLSQLAAASAIFFTAITATAAWAQTDTQAPATQAPATQTPAKPAEELPDGPAPQASVTTVPNGPHVIFETSMGRMVCQFYEKQAPKTVANFIGLATGTKDWIDPQTHKKVHGKPFFDGTIFHRVIPDFMIQGGDRLGTGMGDPGYQFEDEFDPNLSFDAPGKLAMANSGPNTDGSQFFITEAAYPSLSQHYTLFGQCDDDSVQIVKAIARVERDGNDKPLTDVVLRKVIIIPEGQPVPPPPASNPTPAAAPATGPAGN